MNHISLDTEADNVRQFFLSLALEQAGTVIECNGQAVAYIVPMPAKNGHHDEPWTDAKNQRRCDFIDRKYRGEPLTPAELVELEQLQDEMDAYVDRVAPVPLNAARKLHQELLMRASQQPSS